MSKKQKTHTPKIEQRPPVVVVMGHIDHGKSTLLDYIRSSNTVAGEVGGITQNVSAYEVEREHAGLLKKITFIDTPGHEAFQAMRERGAQIGDVAILVVAADDGVNAQTIEAYQTIKDSGLSFMVAINKIDSPQADINKTISSLIENEIYLEGYGGDVPYNNISALKGDGIEDLLDTIHLIADLEELTADRNAAATGFVLESNIDPRAGIAATLIIKSGTLDSGEVVIAGSSHSPVRVLRNFQGQAIKTASFSSPVQVVGFDKLPEVGSAFTTYKNKKEALGALKEAEITKTESSSAGSSAEVTIPLVIKSSSAGAIEAVEYELSKLEQTRAQFKIIATGIGNINEGDIRLAGSQKNGIVAGFGVEIDKNAKDLIEQQLVSTAVFQIIYELIEWLEKELTERSPRHTIEKVIGQAKILKTFNRSKSKQIIGGKITEGYLSKGAKVNIVRREEIIGKGSIFGLQQSRVETDSVEAGNEFGGSIEARIEVAPGDVLQSFIEVEE